MNEVSRTMDSGRIPNVPAASRNTNSLQRIVQQIEIKISFCNVRITFEAWKLLSEVFLSQLDLLQGLIRSQKFQGHKNLMCKLLSRRNH